MPLCYAQLIERFWVLFLQPGVCRVLEVRNPDVCHILVVDCFIPHVVVGDGRQVNRRLKRPVSKAVLRVGVATGIGDHLRVNTIVAILLCNVPVRVAVAQVAKGPSVGWWAHALRGDVLVARRTVGNACTVYRWVVQWAVCVVIVQVALTASVLDAGSPLEPFAVVVLRKKRWWCESCGVCAL